MKFAVLPTASLALGYCFSSNDYFESWEKGFCFKKKLGTIEDVVFTPFYVLKQAYYLF